jgi:glycine betaine/proline transport system permease protein
MSATAIQHASQTRSSQSGWLSAWPWLVVLIGFIALWQTRLPDWAFTYPAAWQIPAQRWIGAAMQWLLDSATFGLFTFTDLTRFFG